MKTTNLEAAQTDLDKRIEDYYSRTDDGGNHEELMQIAFRVARKYDIDPELLNY